MKENIMSKEAFNELIDGLEYVESLTEYGRKNIKYHVQKLQQENKILKENAENNDKVVDKVNWKNMLLKKENKQLKDELKSKPDAQITLQDDKENKFMLIQTERINMQVELNKTIQKLFNNWNGLKEYLHNVDVVIDYSENYDGRKE